jgi:L-lactate dehydrogenase (cytochrome)
VLTGAKNRSSAIELFGRTLSFPLLLAPTGLTGLIWPEGEIHAAMAAREAGVAYCLSSNATVSIERLAAASQHPFWFQIYIMKDKELTKAMIARAEAAGCDALVVTVDLPVAGRRERDLANGLTIPPKINLRNALNVTSRPSWLKNYLTGPSITFQNYATDKDKPLADMARFISEQFDPSVTWDTIAWAKSIFKRPVLVKGILTAEDARRALQSGADGVIVSNHGGRQLDGASSSIRALPQIAEAVGADMPILLDGGVRRGADIVRARALGATACLIGRPFLYGLAASGRSGVSTAIELLRAEFDNALALLGIASAAEIGRDALEPQAEAGSAFRRLATAAAGA